MPDYGSTIGSTVQTAEIDDDAVTYAKMQNISATDRLLGRDTAGAGDTEEISLGAGLTFSGSGSITIDGTVVTETSTDTLTNKTIDALSNSFRNVCQMPTKGRWGDYFGSASDSEEGIMQGSTTSGTGGFATDANGPYRTLQTAATTGSIGGKRRNSVYFRGALNPVLQFIWKCEQVTNSRFYCGITDQAGALANSDTPLNNQSGILLGFRSTDTNWQLIRNDGDVSQDVTDTGVAIDTGLHWFEIVKSSGGWTIRFGNYTGGAYATQYTPAEFTTEIPASTTDMLHNISLITNENVAKTLDLYAMAIHID